MAPELMTPVDIPQKHEYHTKATDVWAFGMVVYVRIRISCFEYSCLLIVSQEALSGDIPFKDSRNDAQVMMSIVSGTLPAKPEERRAQGEVFERLWRCCLDCWVRDPAKRPRMMEVAIRLNVSWSYLIRSITEDGLAMCVVSTEPAHCRGDAQDIRQGLGVPHQSDFFSD
jgi:serine/threonine protein kinase